MLSGDPDRFEEWAEALYGSGCDDALFGFQNGRYFLDFHREAPTFRIALFSAISSLERSGAELELVGIESIKD